MKRFSKENKELKEIINASDVDPYLETKYNVISEHNAKLIKENNILKMRLKKAAQDIIFLDNTAKKLSEEIKYLRKELSKYNDK